MIDWENSYKRKEHNQNHGFHLRECCAFRDSAIEK